MTRRPLKPKSKPQNCATRGTRRETLTSYGAIVAHYLANYNCNADAERRFYRGQPTFEDALKNAALAKLKSGKRANHQRRLSASTLAAAWKALKRCDLQKCKTFHELFSLVDATVRPINGIGELYVYDTALRIGANLRLKPDRIYLHAGTRTGARALGFAGSNTYIRRSDLPAEFRILQPHQIEDCLCIYKHALQAIKSRKSK